MEIEKKIEGMNRVDKMNYLKSLSAVERVLYDKYKTIKDRNDTKTTRTIGKRQMKEARK